MTNPFLTIFWPHSDPSYLAPLLFGPSEPLLFDTSAIWTLLFLAPFHGTPYNQPPSYFWIKYENFYPRLKTRFKTMKHIIVVATMALLTTPYYIPTNTVQICSRPPWPFPMHASSWRSIVSSSLYPCPHHPNRVGCGDDKGVEVFWSHDAVAGEGVISSVLLLVSSQLLATVSTVSTSCLASHSFALSSYNKMIATVL
jgi:hypothetical protein